MARTWFGFSRPAPGVTTPKRSASASFPSARSKRSRSAMRRAIAYGEDGSIRILPSQSRVMKPQARVDGRSLVTVRSRPCASAMARPPRDAGAAHRVHADAQPGARDGRHVHDRRQVRHVRALVVVRALRRAGGPRRHRRGAAALPRAAARWRRPADRTGDVRVGRPAVRRVVLEAAVRGRVVRRRDHDAVGKAARPAAVVGQDRVGDAGRGRVAVQLVDQHLDAVGDEHLDGGPERGFGQRVRVAAR